MSGIVARQRAESALRFLPQKTDQLEAFHIGNFLQVLRDFLELMERDDVLLHLTAALRRKLTRSGKDWADETVKKNAVEPLPEDPIACLAFRYDCMRAVRTEKIDLRYFVSCFYPGAHLNEKLMHWKRAIVHPFAADARRLAARLLERLPDGEYVDMEPLAQDTLEAFRKEAFGPRSWTDADDEAPREARPKAKPTKPAKPSASSTLEDALAQLEEATRSASGLSSDERHDAELEAKILALEAKKKDRSEPRIEARLETLSAHATLASALEAVRKKLGTGGARTRPSSRS